MRILALDLGDKWVGSALADPLGITCRPYKTVTLKEVVEFLKTTIVEHDVATIVIGLPRTISGTESQQTTKVRGQADRLRTTLDSALGKKLEWILWDERLSSKRAQIQSGSGFMNKEQKIKEHSVAAAFILQTYLDGKALFAQDTTL